MKLEGGGLAVRDHLKPDGRCRGCGAVPVGRYCHECGQVADPDLPGIGVLLRDAVVETFSLDGRLWRSLRLLLTDPGELSRAYLRGERSPYLSPVQLLLVSGVPALLVAANVPRRLWGSLYDFTLQVPGDIFGDWAAWMVLLLAAPAMAFTLTVLFFRSGRRPIEHLVVSLHFFSAMLALATLQTALVPAGQRVPLGLAVLEWVGVVWAFVLGFRMLRSVYSATKWGATWRIAVLSVLYLAGYMWMGRAFS